VATAGGGPANNQNTVYVKGPVPNISIDALKAALQKFGNIRRATAGQTKDGKPGNFAHVEFEGPAMRDACLKEGKVTVDNFSFQVETVLKPGGGGGGGGRGGGGGAPKPQPAEQKPTAPPGNRRASP
jgi:hypothetical protein